MSSNTIISDAPNCGVTYDCLYDDRNSFIIQATDASTFPRFKLTCFVNMFFGPGFDLFTKVCPIGQCLQGDRLVPQVCSLFWLGDMPLLLDSPLLTSFLPG